MARNITLRLGAGLGASLGPNFNLTANAGTVTPSTATKTELTAGKSVSVDDAATTVTVTSTGTCTTAITRTIPCAPTTTTTTGAPSCISFRIENNNEYDLSNISYYDCSGTLLTNVFVGSGQQIIFCANTSYGPIGYSTAQLFEIGPCETSTTTTTTAAPTTTTIGPGSLDWDCVGDTCTYVGPGLGAYISLMECQTLSGCS